MWHFIQGWRHRSLVDAKVFDAKKSLVQKGFDPKNLSEEGKSALRKYIRKEWGIRVG